MAGSRRKPDRSRAVLTALSTHGAVAKAAFHPDGSLASVEFFPPVSVEARALGQPSERKVEYVPGTTIPDDKSPLNPLDTLLHVPKYDAHEVDA